MTVVPKRARDELVHYMPGKKCCQIAELSALLHLDGTYRISGQSGHSFTVECPGANTAKKIFTLMRSNFEVEMELYKVERNSPRNESVYRLEIKEQGGYFQMLNEVGVLDSNLKPAKTIPARIVHNRCCVGAALRGAFLGGGFISEPFGKADFEITFSIEELSRQFLELLRRKEIDAELRNRRGQWVLYLKKRQDITGVLAIMGSHGTCLEWESQTIMNSVKNNVNRLVNCDSANADRLARASLRQREVINNLKSSGEYNRLDPELLELAEARLAHPQASYSELGKMLSPPVPKSVVQARMKKIESCRA